MNAYNLYMFAIKRSMINDISINQEYFIDCAKNAYRYNSNARHSYNLSNEIAQKMVDLSYTHVINEKSKYKKLMLELIGINIEGIRIEY